jgi:hypothetical protein
LILSIYKFLKNCWFLCQKKKLLILSYVFKKSIKEKQIWNSDPTINYKWWLYIWILLSRVLNKFDLEIRILLVFFSDSVSVIRIIKLNRNYTPSSYFPKYKGLTIGNLSSKMTLSNFNCTFSSGFLFFLTQFCLKWAVLEKYAINFFSYISLNICYYFNH